MVLADRCELILEWMNEPYSTNRVKWSNINNKV